MDTVEHWIDGRPHGGEGTRLDAVHDPATGEQVAQVRLATPGDVDRVVDAARAALPGWRSRSLSRRTAVLFALRNLVDEHSSALARIVTREHGKVLDDAEAEVRRGLDVLDFACGVGQLLKGEFSQDVSTGVDVYSVRQPVGVCVGITPFNFPVMVPMWMFPVALACGNTFVLKPSEKDPSASLLLAELARTAGVPDGVLNVLQGDAVAVDALLTHPGVDAVSFVGSTPVARHVYETASASGKRVQALGGAKNHAVVLPDADVGQAADAVTSAAYGSAGERCMAVSAVVAVGDVADPLVAALKARVERITVAPGTEREADMGPLVTAEHRRRVAAYVDTGVDEGANLVVDGRGQAGPGQGFFLGPTLFDQVTPDMTIYREEIFGPVLVVLRVATFEDALRLVDDNPYGNGVAIFTNDGALARAFASRVQAGMVGVNVPIPVPVAYYSFGGWKQSLFGALHVHGPEGVLFYTRGKVVTTRWPDAPSRGLDLGFPVGG